MKEKLKSLLCWFLSIFIVNLFSITIGTIASFPSSFFLSIIIDIALCLLLLKLVQRINSSVVFLIISDFNRGIRLMKISGIWIVIFQVINLVSFAYEPNGLFFGYVANLIYGIIYWIGYGKALEE